MADSEESVISVNITHIIDPHRFWYFHLDDLPKHENFLMEIKDKLYNIFKPQPVGTVYSEDDYVVIFFIPLKTLLRGKILGCYPDMTYVCWALDYGFPIKTKSDLMAPLPRDLQMKTEFIKHGGLYNIMPNSELPVWEGSATMELWSMIYSVAIIMFKCKFQLHNGHVIGELLLNFRGRNLHFDSTEYLIDYGCAKRYQGIFLEFAVNHYAFVDLSTTERYADNNDLDNTINPNRNKLIALEITNSVNNASVYTPYMESIVAKMRNITVPPISELTCPDSYNFFKDDINKSKNSITSFTQTWNTNADDSEIILASSANLEENNECKFINNKTNGVWNSNDLNSENYDNISSSTNLQEDHQSDDNDDEIDSDTTDDDDSNVNSDIILTAGVNLQENHDSDFNNDDIETENLNASEIMSESVNLENTDENDDSDSNYIGQLMLAHCRVVNINILHIYEANFAQPIVKALYKLGFRYLYRTQCFAWPYVMRGNTLLLINSPGTGRTWSYLPALCSIVYEKLDSIEKTKKDQKQEPGPLAIVVVRNPKCADNVSDACSSLLAEWTDKKVLNVLELCGSFLTNNERTALLSGCGVLVSTISKLNLILQLYGNDKLISMNRLQMIVFDEFDGMRNEYPDLVKSMLQSFYWLKKKNQGTFPQLVITAQYWHGPLMQLVLQQFGNTPLLLFGDLLEAAVYGRANLQIKFASLNEKIDVLITFLKNQCDLKTEATVIYCRNDEDVTNVSAKLKDDGFACLSCLDSSPTEFFISACEWKEKHNGKLLIITDNYPELRLRTAFNLIHYSFPDSWSKFKIRFTALAESLHDITNCPSCIICEPHPLVKPPKSLVLFDETNELELPRIIDFLKKHNRKVDPQLELVVKNIHIRNENQRSARGIELCERYLTFGECSKPVCNNRHLLTRLDMQATSECDLPTEGQIQMIPLKVYTPLHLAVTLIYEKSIGTNYKWQALPQFDNSTALHFDLNAYYQNENNRRPHWPPKVNDICVIKSDKFYQRLRILTDVINVPVSDLLLCPYKFCVLPPMAIDVRLHCGLVPFGGERDWETASLELVKEWCQTLLNNERQMLEGTIVLTLPETIFVKKLSIFEELAYNEGSVREKDWKYHLIKYRRALFNEETFNKIQNIILGAKALQYQVRLEEDLSLNETFLTAMSDIDTEQNTSEQDLRLVDEQIEELPNTTLPEKEKHDERCPSIEPYEAWQELPISKVVYVDLVKEEFNGNWSKIYIFNSHKVQEFEAMMDYIIEVKPWLPEVLADDDVSLASRFNQKYYVLKYKEYYVRAKMQCISEIRGEISYCFILPDYAEVVHVFRKDLKSGILYESSNKIVEMLPFQTISVTLNGIQMRTDTDTLFKLTPNQRMFVVPLREMFDEETNYGIKMYEVRLFAEDENNELTDINKKLLQLGLATQDGDLESCNFDHTEQPGPSKRSTAVKRQFQVVNLHELISNLEFENVVAEAAPLDDKPTSSKLLDTTQHNNNATEETKEDPCIVSQMRLASSIQRHPNVTWYQTSAFIFIKIATNTKNYKLSCDGEYLIYYEEDDDINNKKPVTGFLMKLFNTVHETPFDKMVGLSIDVRLLKTHCDIWPFLLENGEENQLRWIHYDWDHLEETGTDHNKPKSHQRNSSPSKILDTSDNSDSDFDNDDQWLRENYGYDEVVDD